MKTGLLDKSFCLSKELISEGLVGRLIFREGVTLDSFSATEFL